MIADTDVLIDFLDGREPFAQRIALEIEARALATTAITRFELLSGVRNEKQERTLAVLLAVLPTLPLDARAADRAARVRRALDRRGEPIGMGDSLIAGIVLENGGILLTGNRRHFERIEGLAVSPLRKGK